MKKKITIKSIPLSSMSTKGLCVALESSTGRRKAAILRELDSRKHHESVYHGMTRHQLTSDTQEQKTEDVKMSNRDKEISYRAMCLVSQGKTHDEALEIATAEYRAVQESQRDHYRRESQQRERIKITPDYGLKSRVGKIDLDVPDLVISDNSHDKHKQDVKHKNSSVSDLPHHSVDALGRYRFKPARDGKISTEIERVETTVKKIKRDGTFRQRVLGTYGTACVICGYSNHVEAAHLTAKHQANDDRTENGAPLCPNHHWELDHGLLTVDEVRIKRDCI